jgi:hypothetical protein
VAVWCRSAGFPKKNTAGIETAAGHKATDINKNFTALTVDLNYHIGAGLLTIAGT